LHRQPISRSIWLRLTVDLPIHVESLVDWTKADINSRLRLNRTETTWRNKTYNLLKSEGPENRIQFLHRILKDKPNAYLIIDPVEMLFRIDTGKKGEGGTWVGAVEGAGFGWVLDTSGGADVSGGAVAGDASEATLVGEADEDDDAAVGSG
jgi:hypothetical protein